MGRNKLSGTSRDRKQANTSWDCSNVSDVTLQFTEENHATSQNSLSPIQQSDQRERTVMGGAQKGSCLIQNSPGAKVVLVPSEGTECTIVFPKPVSPTLITLSTPLSTTLITLSTPLSTQDNSCKLNVSNRYQQKTAALPSGATASIKQQAPRSRKGIFKFLPLKKQQ